MGFYDDRSNSKTSVSLPKELTEVSQRLMAILWSSSQLSQLHRIKSSKKIESLKSELTSWLDDPNFIPYSTLLETVCQQSLKVKEQGEQLERLQSELNNRPIREIVIDRVQYVEKPESDVIHTSRSVLFPILVFGMILGGIITLIIPAILRYL